MTSRIPNLALRKIPGNALSENKFRTSVAFLESIMKLFQEIMVGNGAQFKPVLGVIISTKSIIELSTYLIDEKGYQYVIAGRLTSDCVEDIFFLLELNNLARMPYNLNTI